MRSADLTIDANPASTGKISPFIYGHFVEFIDDLTAGIRSEFIRNPCFAKLTPPARGYYHRPEDFDRDPWRPFTHKATMTCGPDAERPWAGSQSMRMVIAHADENGFAGIKHEKIPIREGVAYKIEIHLRGQRSRKSELYAGLGYQRGALLEVLDSFVMSDIGNEWQKFSGVLMSPVSADAELLIWSRGKGRFHFGRVSVREEAEADGFRRDVIEATKALKPGMMRFGGSSMLYYDWKRGLAPPDRREPFVNQPWGETESGEFGFLELLEFCRRTNCEPLMCTNWHQGDPRENAEWVEYCNGSVQTSMGKIRAQNGHPETYGVKYWQVGNEVAGQKYERNLPDFCRAMKAVDRDISLLSSFPSEEVLQKSGEYLDFICPHYYTRNLDHIRNDITKWRQTIRRTCPDRDIKLAVTEWNCTAGDWGADRIHLASLGNALRCARILHIFQRECDIVRIANFSNLVNSFCGGVIQTGPEGLFKTPTHLVLELFSNLCGESVLPAGGDHETSECDLNATTDSEGTIVITAVNESDHSASVSIRLDGLPKPPATGERFVVNGKSPDNLNSFAVPDRVKVETGKLDWCEATGRLELPAYSVSVIRLERPHDQ